MSCQFTFGLFLPFRVGGTNGSSLSVLTYCTIYVDETNIKDPTSLIATRIIPVARSMPSMPTKLSTRLLLALATTLASVSCATPPTKLQPGQLPVRVDAQGLALDGHDAVSYFTESGPLEGRPEWQTDHAGATYRFSKAENLEEFRRDPERYLPAYGGWCAWAMADGEGTLVTVDPDSFLVEDERLLLFFDGLFADTRAFWLEGDRGGLTESADENWRRIRAARD